MLELEQLSAVSVREAENSVVHPALVIWTEIHGDETDQREIVSDFIATDSRFADAVHLSGLHEDAKATRTRGALIDDASDRTLLPGVSYVFVQENPINGDRRIVSREPVRRKAGWKLRPMLDLNRMSTHHGTNGSVQSYMEELAMRESGDPRHVLFSRMLGYPSALIVSMHEDRDRKAKYSGRRHTPDGVYAYATGSKSRLARAVPLIQNAMKEVRRAGFAVYHGVDDAFDPTLRRIVRKGIILDEIDEHTVPDSSLEHWFALASHRGMTSNGTVPLQYPLVLTIEIPQQASKKEKSDVVELLMNHMVAPVWSSVYPDFLQ